MKYYVLTGVVILYLIIVIFSLIERIIENLKKADEKDDL